MKTLYHCIKLLRPLNVIIAGSTVIIASAILNSLQNPTTVLYSLFVVVFFTAGANALNDAIDHEIDLINCPTRPIPIGIITPRKAILISFICFTLGVVFCLKLSEGAKVIGIVISMPLMVVYSTHLKGKVLIGNFVVASILGLSFLFCGSVHQQYGPMWAPAALAFGLTLLRELVKDIADIKGDLSVGLATFPIIVGIEKSIRLAVFLSIFIGLFAFYPYLNGVYGLWYFYILIIGVEIPLLVVVAFLLYNPSILVAKYAAKILKFSTIMGLIAIYAGSQL